MILCLPLLDSIEEFSTECCWAWEIHREQFRSQINSNQLKSLLAQYKHYAYKNVIFISIINYNNMMKIKVSFSTLLVKHEARHCTCFNH